MAKTDGPKTRSYNMSRIRAKDTIPEMLVRKFLYANGFRYRIHDKKLAGKPDIVLQKYRTAILINGCFWHGHQNCKRASLPKTNEAFWSEKIRRNLERDKKNLLELRILGWRVITIWQCELKNKEVFKSKMDFLIRSLSF